MLLKDKVVIISGATLSFAICFVREFLKNGLKGVTIIDTDVIKGKELISSFVTEYGPDKAIFLKADVTKQSKFEDALKRTVEVFGSIDIVINVTRTLNERNLEKQMDVNFQIALDKYLLRYKSVEEAIIVNIALIYDLDECEFARAAYEQTIIELGKNKGSNPSQQKSTAVKILTLYLRHSNMSLCLDMAKKVLSVERYQDITQKLWGSWRYQRADFIARALIRILEKFENGDMWLIEGHQCYQIEIPQMFDVRKIKKMCL